MAILKLQQTLERLAGLLRSETRAQLVQFGLQPVQFEALCYLADCNRYSDTPGAVTEFLGQTKGTVSQTLNVLEKKGLIRKVSDKNDRRVTHLKVCSKGHKLLARLQQSPMLKKACEQITDSDVSESLASLSSLLYQLQKANGFKSFGLCSSCVHNNEQNGQTFCGLTGEPLSAQDIQLICREHSPILYAVK